MRIFALSDLHVDYQANARWVSHLSRSDHTDDLLILAGDISHKPSLLAWCLEELSSRWDRVLFVPGNHDLWVRGKDNVGTSLDKFQQVCRIARDCGVDTRPLLEDDLWIVPLLGWYDYSFGQPGEELASLWMDYRACRWPEGFGPKQINEYFAALNFRGRPPAGTRVITFSHFLPRPDLIPDWVADKFRFLDPVLGTTRLEEQLRPFGPDIHVYGHSHVNRSVVLDGVRYVNNAFGNPQEGRIAAKRLLCLDDL